MVSACMSYGSCHAYLEFILKQIKFHSQVTAGVPVKAERAVGGKY